MRTLVETRVLQGERGLPSGASPADHPGASHGASSAGSAYRSVATWAKGLLQTAAVIVHEVPLPLLQAIADRPEEVLHRSLARTGHRVAL